MRAWRRCAKTCESKFLAWVETHYAWIDLALVLILWAFVATAIGALAL